MEEQQETSFWIPLEREILTEIQLSICDLIIEGSTDQGIINKFDPKSKGNIGKCMGSTISGNIWSPGRITGGPNGYLSDVEKCLFVNNIKNPITLEAARRKYYNVSAIRNFFQSHQELLINTCSFLIWNADETSSESSRKYKVLMTDYINNPICPDSK